jgi:murein L,D-transpeptidase YafK
MKKLCIVLFLTVSLVSRSQTAVSFLDFQRSLPRPSQAMLRQEDTLARQFQEKGLDWPAKYVYFRSFKYDGQLEVWVKNERNQPFQLFKTYKVCALAGTLGPKRMEGDYQVPEGFYYINEFNPRSTYHLSLGINYPNVSDRLLSDMEKPGGDIYIHGSCVTVGCIPVRDEQIEELYIIAAHAKNNGQDFIPVHIFPIRYDNKRSADYLTQLTKTDPSLKQFASNLESVYEHFEATRQLPVIMVGTNGEYKYSGLSKKVTVAPLPVTAAPKKQVQHRVRNITAIPDAVTTWPEFPGGGDHFLKYLKKMGSALSTSLPAGTPKAYVTVEFIIDADGVPTNFNVVKGVSQAFDDELITVLEQMPPWKPAILNDKPVAKKMKQGFAIE